MEQVKEKKLIRSQKDRMIAGVCAGLGEYFDIDPVIIRLVFVVLFFAGGSAFLAYIILWIVIPEASKETVTTAETPKQNAPDNNEKPSVISATASRNPSRSKTVFGLIIIAVGAMFLFDNFKIITWGLLARLWPLILVLLGIIILARKR